MTCNSSNYFMVSLFVQFLSTYCLDKNLLVPCSLFYSAQLVNRNHTYSPSMKHLCSLHVLTIFNHFWILVIPKHNIKFDNALAQK